MLFPKSTEFNKRIPKQKFYNNLEIAPKLKKDFADQIQSILWSNKLSPATINLPAGKIVTEIEVFTVILNVSDPNEAILRLIDRQIPYHILFVLMYNGKARLSIAQKSPSELGSDAFKVNKYFYTPWQSEENLLLTLKGLDLDAVWENLIVQVGGITIEQGNTLDQQIAADEKRAKLLKEIARLEKLARAEKQPKKKFELAQQINRLRTQL